MVQNVVHARSVSGAARAAYAAAAVSVVDLARFFVLPLLHVPAGAPLARYVDALLPIALHLLLFPVVAALPAPQWARAAGWGWLSIDIATDVMALNGVPSAIYLPLRYGGHVSAALWIGAASWRAQGALRLNGLLLALDLGGYSFIAPYVPFFALLPSLVLLPVWFALAGRVIARTVTAATGQPQPVAAA